MSKSEVVALIYFGGLAVMIIIGVWLVLRKRRGPIWTVFYSLLSLVWPVAAIGGVIVVVLLVVGIVFGGMRDDRLQPMTTPTRLGNMHGGSQGQQDS